MIQKMIKQSQKATLRKTKKSSSVEMLPNTDKLIDPK